jgi:hypothetical protein
MIPRVYVTKNYELNEKRLNNKFDHMPVAIEEKGACILCRWKSQENVIKMNAKHPHETYITCTDCEVYLCCQSGRNCFYEYHKKAVTTLKRV